jgi:ABC-type branched-subunit amino acid transport system substrate-binding protein
MNRNSSNEVGIRRRSARVVPVMAATAVLALVGSACGSSSKSTSPTTAAPSGTATTVATPTATPYSLFEIADSANTQYPEIKAAAEAAIKTINGAGGVNGHPLTITVCDTNRDPNQAATCARQAASDQSIVAVVGRVSEYGGSIAPVLSAAGLPDIGESQDLPADATEKVGFPLSASATVAIAAQATECVDILHATTIGLAIADVPAAHAAVPFLQSTAKAKSASLAAPTFVPITATDLSSVVESTAKNAKCVVVPLFPSQVQAYLTSEGQLGLSTPIVINGVTPESALASVGSAASNGYAVLDYAVGSPGYSQYVTEMNKYSPSAQKDEYSLNMWLSVEVFDQIAKTVSGTVTRSSLLAALNSASSVDTSGLTPTLDFSKPATGLGGSAPRSFNSSIVYGRFANGHYEDLPFNGKTFVSPLG